MTIGAPWEVPDWERIAWIYTVSTQKANERSRLGSLVKEVWHDHFDTKLGRNDVRALNGLGPEAEDVEDT